MADIPPATAPYDWILAITTIAFVFASASNGANDVANSYATSGGFLRILDGSCLNADRCDSQYVWITAHFTAISNKVAARTLKLWQAGVLAAITEFVGAVALGARVTDTIKNGIITIDRFEGRPAVLMLAMGCAEVGNATWLTVATLLGMPVSTTQTIVGSLIGVGFAAQSAVTWGWESGSVSQVAASWGIAPFIAAGFSAIIFGIVKYTVLERKNAFEWAMRLIPIYMASTGAILVTFLGTEVPDSQIADGWPLGVTVVVTFFFVLFVAYVFFKPYFYRKLVKEDKRLRIWHVPLGPLLYRENVSLYWPANPDELVTDYYEEAYEQNKRSQPDEERATSPKAMKEKTEGHTASQGSDSEGATNLDNVPRHKKHVEPRERWIVPVQDKSWFSPHKWWNWTKYILLQGVARDAVTHNSDSLREIHARARKYDVRVEHLFTYCQVVSAMMMSIAHGSNDVANAVGPWAATYQTWRSGVVNTEADTPVWFLVVAGLLLGIGFWFYGYHIIRSLGNRITQMSPSRGFSIELGAAITVLLASSLALPVSTTQCLVGASMGVALMNYDIGAVNWKQLVYIFGGWVLTLPAAGLISGLLCLMALNAPSF